MSLVNERTVIDFERGARRTYPRTIADLRRAFEEAGVEFIDENGGGAGVRFRDGEGLRRDRDSRG
ncbi:MAG: transcriptional regulator [Bauldia litoralis]